MARILMIAPAPVIKTGGRVRLDVKFVEGMCVQQAHWPSRITCLLRRDSPAIPFGRDYDPADLPFDQVILVLEGKASAGVPSGTQGIVTVVHAPGSGDDELVAQCRATSDQAEVTLVSADRGLTARVEALGVATCGPRTLYSWLA